MALDQRSAIFELRSQGVPIRQIAAQMGLSAGKVQRELAKRAAPGAGGEPAAASPSPFDSVGGVDPGLLEQQRAIARKRLQIQESDLELRSLEQNQRLAVLQGAARGGGGDGQLAALLLAQVEQMRSELRERGAPRESGGLIEELQRVKTLGSAIASFAPPSAPSGPAEVEFKVAMARIQVEEQRIEKARQDELAVRHQQAASENMRNEAIAKFVESFGPIIGQVAQKWIEDRTGGSRPAPVALSGADFPPAPGDEMPAAAGEIQGECPACGVAIAMSEGSSERCPGCGAQLRAEAGLISQPVSPNGAAGRAATVTY